SNPEKTSLPSLSVVPVWSSLPSRSRSAKSAPSPQASHSSNQSYSFDSLPWQRYLKIVIEPPSTGVGVGVGRLGGMLYQAQVTSSPESSSRTIRSPVESSYVNGWLAPSATQLTT